MIRLHRRTKIIATPGPTSATPDVLARLFRAGADVFRLNVSHTSHNDHRERIGMIQDLEKVVGRPIGILADVQGPKLRAGRLCPRYLTTHRTAGPVRQSTELRCEGSASSQATDDRTGDDIMIIKFQPASLAHPYNLIDKAIPMQEQVWPHVTGPLAFERGA